MSVRPLLLIQVRDADDRMLDHELDCVERRVAERGVPVRRENALIEVAKLEWLDGMCAVIIGGSGNYSVHDPRSQHWVGPLRDLLEASLTRSIPGFGICFGHQLLGQHLGATIETAPKHAEFGTVELALTPTGQEDPVFGQLPPSFHAQTGHSDSVMQLPDGVELLATSARLNRQAFRVRGTKTWSAQFHPELTATEARERYIAYQASFQKASKAAAPTLAEQFVTGSNEAAQLLGRFLDTALSREP